MYDVIRLLTALAANALAVTSHFSGMHTLSYRNHRRYHVKRIPVVFEAELSSEKDTADRKAGVITTALSPLADTAMMTAEFYEVIVENIRKPRMYEIDEFIEQRQHSLFQMPANTNRFNSTDIVWVLESLRRKAFLNFLQWE
jgi:hypothetical protein